MIVRRAMSHLGPVAGLLLLSGAASPALSANTPTDLDLPPNVLVPPAVNIGPGEVAPQRAVAREREPSGNPLWGIPLSSLTATRERPIFLPSRRPPAPVVAGPPRVEPVVMRVMPPPPPERPQLTLVGAVVGETEAIGIFLDQANNTVVRLHMGESHAGWLLNSVKGREVTLQKDRETVALALPAPGDSPSAGPAMGLNFPVAGNGPVPVPFGPVPSGRPSGPVPPGRIPVPVPIPSAGGVPIPSAGTLVVPDPRVAAPFIPRSTPKNGEPDGL
jgi:general secretion pathway protein N